MINLGTVKSSIGQIKADELLYNHAGTSSAAWQVQRNGRGGARARPRENARQCGAPVMTHGIDIDCGRDRGCRKLEAMVWLCQVK